MIDEPTLLDREDDAEPLEILFQDEWLAVVNKPAGMLVHPGRENDFVQAWRDLARKSKEDFPNAKAVLVER